MFMVQAAGCAGVRGSMRVREMSRVAPRYGPEHRRPVSKVEMQGGQVSVPVNLSVSPGDIK